MDAQTNKEQTKFVIVSFSQKQLFNYRKIADTEMVSVAFPSSSKYKGYHIDVKVCNLREDKFRKKMKFVYLYGDGKKLILKTIRSEQDSQFTWLSTTEIKREFDSWRSRGKAGK